MPLAPLAAILSLLASLPAGAGPPAVLPVREQVAVVNRLTALRLERLLPRIMRETGIDMWILACNEDDLDPVYKTMLPLDMWTPITQLLVLCDRGPEKGVERLNVSRTNMRGLHRDAWEWRAHQKGEGEGQWECLARIVRERDPKVIGVNIGEVQWAAGSLSVPLHAALVRTLGPECAKRIRSAEPLCTLWLETLLPEELETYAHVVKVGRQLIAAAFAGTTPGATTTDDLVYRYWQGVVDSGLETAFMPTFTIRGRSPEGWARHGKEDRTVRRGDLVHCDVGIRYLRYCTDHQEWAYVLRLGEEEVPESYARAMAEGNRLQDVFASQFVAGRTGDELLAAILGRARELGLPNPRIYSHSLGHLLHEPGPLIGLPWEQVRNPGRGDVRLVPDSCFTAELSVEVPIAEWGGATLRMALEQDVAFTGGRAVFLAGRQTEFHLVR